VALYFALFYDRNIPQAGSPKTEWPTVLVFNKMSLDVDGINFFQRELIDPRTFKQQGGYIDTMSYFKLPKPVCSILIDPAWIPEIFDELRAMNVTGSNLFGTPEMAAVDYFWDCHYRLDAHLEEERKYRDDIFRKNNI
jgi:hypothetical protein